MGEMRTETRFRVERRLRVGGMAELFLARQEGTVRRPVALKQMLPDLAADAEMRARFEEEAQLLATLAGPGLPALIEAGEGEQGPFIVLQYIDGASLGELLRKGGSLSVAQAAHVVSRALHILIRLHGARDPSGKPLQFVHRDLAPENLMVDRSGEVWLLDLGIAKSALSQVKTGAGIRHGRLAYMSPEVLAGRPAQPASDLFSLAMVGAELVGGADPLALEGPGNAGVIAWLEKARPDERVHWPEEVPEEYRHAVGETLALDPGERPSAEELAGRLEAIASADGLAERVNEAAGEPALPGVPTPVLPRVPMAVLRDRRSIRRRMAIATGFIIVVAAVAFALRDGDSAIETPIVGQPVSTLGPVEGREALAIEPPVGRFVLHVDGKSRGVIDGPVVVDLEPGAHSVVLTDETTSRYYRMDFLLPPGERVELAFPVGKAAIRQKEGKAGSTP